MNKVAAKYGGKDKLRAKYRQGQTSACHHGRNHEGQDADHARTDAKADAKTDAAHAKTDAGHNVLHDAQARERSALRRRRREAGDAGSAHPLVQAHRRREVSRHLRRSQRQGAPAGEGQEAIARGRQVA